MAIKNRYDFVMLFDVENGNPNGHFFGDIPKINGIQGMGDFVYCIFTAGIEYRAVKDNIILSACSVFPVPVGYCTYSAQHIRKIL